MRRPFSLMPMLTGLPPELADLLARLAAAGGEPLVIGTAELESWPAALANALRSQGALERMAAATAVECPGCEEACVMPVQVRQADGCEPVAFVACDKRADMGRVALSLERLNRWQMAPRTLAHALAVGLGDAPAPEIAQGWRVGWVEGAKGRCVVLLDGPPAALHISIAGHTLPLADVLTWDGERLGLDTNVLKRHARAPAAGASRESPTARADRLRRRKAELKRKGVRGFLKQIAIDEGISVSRVKEIIGTDECPPRDRAAPNGPFDVLFRPTRQRAPVSSPGKRKR